MTDYMTAGGIAEVCMKARDLILRDGFQKEAAGWTNYNGHGWCIEGALAKAMNVPFVEQIQIVRVVNHSEAGRALRAYLGIGCVLHLWNDQPGCDREQVLQVLAEVAAKHTPPPLPSLPATPVVAGGKKPVIHFDSWVKEWLEEVPSEVPVQALPEGGGAEQHQGLDPVSVW